MIITLLVVVYIAYTIIDSYNKGKNEKADWFIKIQQEAAERRKRSK
jgi:hypothetical protein